MPDHALAVKALDNFVSSVYLSSPAYVRAKDPGACDMEAMTALVCGKENPALTAPWSGKLKNQPIRGVNLGGLFILEPWILSGFINWNEVGIMDTLSFSKKCATLSAGNQCQLYEQHINTFYTQADFDSMKAHGLNSVRITVGFWLFSELSGADSLSYLVPKESINDLAFHPLTKIIRCAKLVGLQVILTLASVSEYDLELTDSHKMTAQSRRDTIGGRSQQPVVSNDPSSVTIATAGAMAAYVDMLSTHSLDNVMIIEINTALPVRVVDTVGDKDTVELSIARIRKTLPSIPIMLLDSSFVPHEDVTNNVFINTKVYHSGSVQDIASDNPEADREKMFAHEKIACGFKAPLHFTTCTRRPTLVGEFSLAIDDCIMRDTNPQFADYGQCNYLSERLTSGWWHRHIKSFTNRQIDTYERELGWVFSNYKLDDKTERENPSAIYWSFKMAAQEGILDIREPSHGCAHKPDSDFFMGDATYPPSTSMPVYYWIPPQPTLMPTAAPSAPRYSTGSAITMSVVALAFLAAIVYAVFSAFGTRGGNASRGGYTALSNV